MSDFGSEAGAVRQGASYVDEYHESLTATVKTTAAEATAAAAGWIGQGGDAYRRLVEEWKTAGLAVIADLENFSANLRKSDESSHSTDSDLQSQITKLAGSSLDFNQV